MFRHYHLAVEVDRLLNLSLSNAEFEILAEIIRDSEDMPQTARNLIFCGVRATRYCINISR